MLNWKQKRSVRLNYLHCWLITCKNIPNLAAGDKKFNSEIESFVGCWKSIDDIIADLLDQDLISQFYRKKNISVDLWYLLRGISPSSGLRRETNCEGEFLKQILFQTILQALLDLDNGRPCDTGTWRRDLSPDYRNCTGSEHVCKDHAYDYLLSLDPCVDEVVGLQEGMILSLTMRIKKDSINYIESIFSTASTSFSISNSQVLIAPTVSLSQFLDPCM